MHSISLIFRRLFDVLFLHFVTETKIDAFSPALLLEHGIVRCPSVLHRDEEFDSKEATQEEEPKSESKLEAEVH